MVFLSGRIADRAVGRRLRGGGSGVADQPLQVGHDGSAQRAGEFVAMAKMLQGLPSLHAAQIVVATADARLLPGRSFWNEFLRGNNVPPEIFEQAAVGHHGTVVVGLLAATGVTKGNQQALLESIVFAALGASI